VWRNLLEELFFGKVVLYAIGRFTTRVWIGFLHDLVSVLHQNFLKFLVWACILLKFISLKTFTSIPVTFESHISFIGFLWHFGLKFLLNHSWNSPFLGDQMDLFSKPVYIPSIPLNLVYKPI
jgi:hypothetical protein